MAYLLIVDDDRDFATAAAGFLRGAGHDVEIALDTDEAVRSMKARRPDLAIVDVMFPENTCGGFELARTIRHHDPDLQGIPVLILTAINTKFPLGFDRRDIDENWLPVLEFVEKPVDFGVMLEKISMALEQAWASDPADEPEPEGSCPAAEEGV